jgi:predicted transcriptional regulator
MSEPKPRRTAEEQDDDALRAAVAEGLADDAAGRTIPYEDVRRWLLSWGTDEELPPPQCG